MSIVTDAHREWIAEALAAPFETPRRIPTLGRSRPRAEPLPDLFRDILDALDAPLEPEAPAPFGMSPGDLLRSHFGDALPGQSALTVRRRELKRQREEAADVEVAEAAEKARRDRELPPLDQGVVMQEPELADQVEVKEALYDVVPRGVPHFQKATLAVHRSPGRIIADVRLFDDEIGRVEITGPEGARGYRWHHSGVAGTDFNWNEGARCWERIPYLYKTA
ncbi:hypothetical protein IPV08_10595 [Methylobacterium sp. SD274]|uniref:Uncharacterized protein n=1 Tax=Methylobacterium gossipiicola TaxID=582675 RepID=A0A1I2UVE6_9HYPH|nr:MULTISPECIES: hypothetical protein [Methylobacterium]MBO1020416.1 hypothetical protein [Methylobacterium sp. SD274]SFG81114.1 hypothetical protein SAMN05192565_11226 [Methylobacterium gossipiicola]